MKTELAALEELQNLDLEILQQTNELSAIPKELEEQKAVVTHVGDLLERERARLAEAEQFHAAQAKEIAMQNEILTKSRGKLSSARNEKEQKAAQREIDTIRKIIQEREEDSLKLLEASEQYRNAINEHSKEFEELVAHLKASEDEGIARMAEVQAIVDSVDSRRADIAARIPKDVLRLYDRIQKRLGRAVVYAEAGCCTGCNLEVLPQVYNQLQRGDKVYQCANCFRILLFKYAVDVNND